MSRVRLDISMSLDGFTAGCNIRPDNPLGDNGERLHDWMFAEATETGRRMQQEVFVGAGAVLMGRTVFDVGKPFWSRETFKRLPVFVVTHRAHESIVEADGSSYTFVHTLDDAVARAKQAAGAGDVVSIGGGITGQQLLAGGYVDELRLHLVHRLLGDGTPLFARGETGYRQMPVTRLVEDRGVTHLICAANRSED
jgi:dihydrofolate reductase